jgi:hypothetical protein
LGTDPKENTAFNNSPIVALWGIPHNTMKAYWRVEVYVFAFLTWAIDGGKWLASSSGRLSTEEIATCTYWSRGWVDFRVGMDAVEKSDIFCPCRKSNPRDEY